jgi:threonine synthase
MGVVQRVCERGDIYLANSMNSLRIEGQKTISIEIVQQNDWVVPDWVVLPTGNAGNISALGYGFLMMRDLGIIDRLPRLVCAQAERANPLYRSFLSGFETYQPVKAQPTNASAIQIGNPVSVRKAIKVLKQFDGVVEQASEDEMANAAAAADRAGLFNCPHTGVALAALLKLLKRGVIQRDQSVVVVSTAHGLKFADWKVKYHLRQLEGIESTYANPPQVVPARLDETNSAIDRFLDS